MKHFALIPFVAFVFFSCSKSDKVDSRTAKYPSIKDETPLSFDAMFNLVDLENSDNNPNLYLTGKVGNTYGPFEFSLGTGWFISLNEVYASSAAEFRSQAFVFLCTENCAKNTYNADPTMIKPGQVLVLKQGIHARSQSFEVSLFASSASELAYGDVSGNGRLSGGDSVLISRHIAGISNLKPWQMSIADANGDQKITAADRQLVASVSVGIELQLPALLGDLNFDGVVNEMDADLITTLDFQSNEASMGAKVALADVNLDYRVDEEDMILMTAAGAGLIEELPFVRNVVDASSLDPVSRLMNLTNRLDQDTYIPELDFTSDGFVDRQDVELLQQIELMDGNTYSMKIYNRVTALFDALIASTDSDLLVIQRLDVDGDEKIDTLDKGFFLEALANLRRAL